MGRYHWCSDTSVLLFPHRIYHSFHSCYHTNIHNPSSHSSISVTSSASLISSIAQVNENGGYYHDKVVGTPPSYEEVHRHIMTFITSTSLQRQKLLLPSNTGSFTYITANKALRPLGLLFGFKMSADDEGDQNIQAIAGVNGSYLRSPQKYAPVSALSGSTLVLLHSKDVPKDSPFGSGTPFTKEDVANKAEWLEPFLDKVYHSLFSHHIHFVTIFLSPSHHYWFTQPFDQVTPIQSPPSDSPSGEFQLVLLPIVLPLLNGFIPPSSNNGDSARSMLDDFEPSWAFWYTALTRALSAFMADIETGNRMKALGDLLPKFNKRHLVLSDKAFVSLLPIDDDTQKQEVISAGASITAKCNELLKLNLNATVQGQDEREGV